MADHFADIWKSKFLLLLFFFFKKKIAYDFFLGNDSAELIRL